MESNSLRPIRISVKAIILHTFWVQVGLTTKQRSAWGFCGLMTSESDALLRCSLASGMGSQAVGPRVQG